jgi:hypothetical protein
MEQVRATSLVVFNGTNMRSLTNVVWVEQPVSTGFSQGIPTATSETDVADQFLGWWENFVDTFGLQNRRVFITGESYGKTLKFQPCLLLKFHGLESCDKCSGLLSHGNAFIATCANKLNSWILCPIHCRCHAQ